MAKHQAFAAQISRIINRLIFLEKKGILEIDGLKLFPSEIHLMEVIAEDKDINAGSMAKKLGISKGAVSQTLSRLEKKGILHKVRNSSFKNELAAHFTEIGMRAIEKHHNLRASLNKEYEEYLASISWDDRQAIQRFLLHVDRFIDRISSS